MQSIQQINRLRDIFLMFLVLHLVEDVYFANASQPSRSFVDESFDERVKILPSSNEGFDKRELQQVETKTPPSNNLCIKATIFDPTVETFHTVDNSSKFAIHDKRADFNFDSPCKFAVQGKPTYWYKFTNPLTTPLSIDITLNEATTNPASNIGIIKGTNCTILRCIGGWTTYGDSTTGYDFIAEPLSSYYILLNLFSGPFNVTFKGRTQFFTVIDSKTDKPNQLLKDNIDYFRIFSSSVNMNIQASFTKSVTDSIKSVRLTFDNPKRIVCDHEAPYSVFGDSFGDYKDATIPLGRHVVTATPYRLPNCTGIAGTTIEQDFRVTGCATEFVIDSDYLGRDVVLRPFTSKEISSIDYYKHTKLPVELSLKCTVDLYVDYECRFPTQSIVTELRNATTGKLIRKSNSTYLFVKRHLAVGSYSVRAIIDNVKHPTMNFTVVYTRCN